MDSIPRFSPSTTQDIFRAPPVHPAPTSVSQSLLMNPDYAWSNGLLLPMVAFTRLLKSVVHRTPKQSSSSAVAFPQFKNGHKLRYIVSFGDSYTDTGFDAGGQQPGPGHPLGNPPYPGYTLSNGPNWIDYLTVQYNQSYIETVNLAAGGAILDDKPIGNVVYTGINKNPPTVEKQILELFEPQYGRKPDYFPWTSNETLFAIFVGINDVSRTWSRKDRETVYDESFATYSQVVDSLYQLGGRNFLLLNVPPTERTPSIRSLPAASRHQWSLAVQDWNSRVSKVVQNLTSTYSDVKAGIIDTHTLFNNTLDDPCSNPLTCPIKDTTHFCVAYGLTNKKPVANSQACKYPADKYYWRDGFHPMWRVHEMLADAIANLLWRLH